MMFTLTDYAMHSDKRHGMCIFTVAAKYWNDSLLFLEHEPSMWDKLDAKFMKHKDKLASQL